MKESSVISEEVVRPGGARSRRDLHPRELPGSFEMGPSALAGAVAASEALKAGKPMDEAIKEAISAREKARSEAEGRLAAQAAADPEVEEMIRYVHAIARLHSGRFEDLTPLGMLEVAMLCPYPVCSLDEWREKMKACTGA